MLRRSLCAGPIALAACLPLFATQPARADATFREGFESPRPTWRQEETDVALNLLAHDRSERAAHEGRLSEHLQFTVTGTGSAVYYSLALPKIPIVDNLKVNLYLRSNRSGMQVLGRVVLPADVDPDTGQPSFVLIAGTIYENNDRWQRLELTKVLAAVQEQVRILRLKTRRKVELNGAYLERVVVNLHGGPGETEVFLDDLSIDPVPEAVVLAPPEPAPDPSRAPRPPDPNQAPSRSGVVVKAGRVLRDGLDWVPTIFDPHGADIEMARQFGVDVLAVDVDDVATAKRAVELGYRLMVKLGPKPGEEPGTAKDCVAAAAQYPYRSSVALWHLGERLGSANKPEVRKNELEWSREIVTGLRDSLPAGARLATGDVSGQFALFAKPTQNLGLIGVDPAYWGSCREPADVLRYLLQRRNLTAIWKVDVPYWGWVDTVPPPVVRSAIWGSDRPPAWGVPRVQPEQLRVATYLTLMAGYKGVGFRGDATLSRDEGKATLYEMGLLNAEIDLVESIIAQGVDPILQLPTYPPDPKAVINYDVTGMSGSMSNTSSRKTTVFPEVKAHPTIVAAAIGTADSRGKLVLIADAAFGAQHQPPQSAINGLKLVVPGIPDNVTAWEISLGGVQEVDSKRQPGGVQFSLEEFGVATMVLLTSDLGLVRRIEAEVNKIRPRAVDLAIKQARRHYEWVAAIHDMLLKDGHKVDDAADLIAQAADSIRSADEALAREDYTLAWLSAHRTSRSLRMVMRAHHDLGAALIAIHAMTARQTSDGSAAPGEVRPKIVVPPVGSAPLLSFATFPQQHVWIDWVRYGSFGASLLKGGDFNRATPETLAEAGWTDDGYKDFAGKIVTALRLDDLRGIGGAGKALRLSVGAADAKVLDTLPAFLDHPLAAIRTPPIPVSARQMIRIRVDVRLPRKLPAGTGGLIVRDSIGGERLQYRTTEATPKWSEVTLFRRVPADGDLTVTLGLAGYGEAYFDNLRIDRLEKVDLPDGEIAGITRAPALRPLPPRPAAARAATLRPAPRR